MKSFTGKPSDKTQPAAPATTSGQQQGPALSSGAAPPPATGMPSGSGSIVGAQQPKPAAETIWKNPYREQAYAYKGQIHCHTCEPVTNKDGYLPGPDLVLDTTGGAAIPGLLAGRSTAYAYWSVYETTRVAQCYKDRGYRFLCFTDHHLIRRLPAVPGVLNIYSLEDGQSNQHHIEVLGIDFNAAKSASATAFDGDHDGICNLQSGPCSNLQRRIYYYSNVQHALTVLGHPRDEHAQEVAVVAGVRVYDDVWAGWMPGQAGGYAYHELRQNAQGHYNGIPYSYTGMEIYNASCHRFDDPWWDQLLEEGKMVWGFAGDDCHDYGNNKRTLNRAWIVVYSPLDIGTLKQADAQAEILRNIRQGNFIAVVRSPDAQGDTPGSGSAYAGPPFSVTLSGSQMTVLTGPETTGMLAITGPNRVHKLRLTPTSDGRKSACFEPATTERYVRFVWEAKHKAEPYRMFSQPLYNRSLMKSK